MSYLIIKEGPSAAGTVRANMPSSLQKSVEIMEPVKKNVLTVRANMPSSQQKLVEIMELVKKKELTVRDAETLFKQWQIQYKGGGSAVSKSFKEKQVGLRRPIRIPSQTENNLFHLYSLFRKRPKMKLPDDSKLFRLKRNDS